MDYYNLLIYFKKWITDDLLLSHNDLSASTKYGGSDKCGYWQTIFKSIFFLTDKNDNFPNIQSQVPLLFAISATCFDFFFFKIFSAAKLKIFTFLIGSSNQDGLTVHSLINASLLFLLSSFIASRYSSHISQVFIQFWYWTIIKRIIVAFVTALIFSRLSLSLVILVWFNSFPPSITLAKPAISKTWLTIHFA